MKTMKLLKIILAIKKMMGGFHIQHTLTTIFITLQIISITCINSCLAIKSGPNPKYSDFIRDSCLVTSYPTLCYNSLSVYATKIQTSPKLLANTALSVTLSSIASTSTKTAELARTRGLRAAETDALHGCIEKLRDAEDKLRKSIGGMGSDSGHASFRLRMNNVRKWLTSALAEENACKDEIVGNEMHELVKAIAKHHVEYVVHITSNAFAIVNNYICQKP